MTAAPIEDHRSLTVVALILILAFTAVLRGQGAVDGKVVTTNNGAGVSKTFVLLQPARIVGSAETRPRDSYLTQSDSNGHFSIAGMVPGTYECVPSRTGFGAIPPDAMPSVKYYPQVTVENGKTASGVLLKLTPLGVISGRILDAEGDPVSHAEVLASVQGYARDKRSELRQAFAQTNDRGEYRLFNLFPGTYHLLAISREGQQSGSLGLRGPRPAVLANTYYPAAADAEQASPVELRAGSEVQGIDIHMQRMRLFSIRGKLPRSDPEHLYAIDVRRRGPDPNQGMFGGHNSVFQGDWEVAGLTPGSFILTMTRLQLDSGRVIRNNSEGNSGPQARAFVEITDHDVDGVEFTLGSGPEVSGLVKTSGVKPQPLDGLQVTLTAEEGENYMSAVKKDGSFTIPNVLPDLYWVSVDPPSAVYPTSMKLGEQELAARQLDLRRGGNVSMSIAVANDFAEAEGKVTDGDGNPDPMTYVTFVPDQKKTNRPSTFKSQVTDAQGHFLIRGLAPGTYTVFAWKDAPRNAPNNPEFRKPFEKQGVSVTLEPGAHQTLELKSIVTEKQ